MQTMQDKELEYGQEGRKELYKFKIKKFWPSLDIPLLNDHSEKKLRITTDPTDPEIKPTSIKISSKKKCTHSMKSSCCASPVLNDSFVDDCQTNQSYVKATNSFTRNETLQENEPPFQKVNFIKMEDTSTNTTANCLDEQPRIIRDTDLYLILYKPPFWNCGVSERFCQLFDINHPIKIKSIRKFIKDNFDPSKFEMLSDSSLHFGFVYTLETSFSGPLIIAKTLLTLRKFQEMMKNEIVSLQFECVLKVLSPIKGQEECFVGDSINITNIPERFSIPIIEKTQKDDNGFPLRVDKQTENWNAFHVCFIPAFSPTKVSTFLESQNCSILMSDSVPSSMFTIDRKMCSRAFCHGKILKFTDINLNEEEKSELVIIRCDLPKDLRHSLNIIKSLKSLGKFIERNEKVSYNVGLMTRKTQKWTLYCSIAATTLIVINELSKPVPFHGLKTSLMDFLINVRNCFHRFWKESLRTHSFSSCPL